ncbi:MAG: response regulator [Bacteroidota bacterium]
MSKEEISGFDSGLPILLIEDNLGDARLVEVLLEEYEIKTQHETNLQEGLEALGKFEFGAVMLDLHLPDSRGFQTVEKLLSHFPETNVIVLTGLPDKDLGLRAVKSGAQDYLVKGEFSGEELAKTLGYSIERNRIKKRLEEAQRIAALGHWEFNLKSMHFSASDEVSRILGMPKMDGFFKFETLMNIIHPDDAYLTRAMGEQLEANNQVEQDMRIIRPNGDLRYITVLCKATRDSENHLYRLTGIVQDITERTLAAKELIRSQILYRTVFDQSADAIYISSQEGYLMDFNQASIDLFGYSEEELRSLKTEKLYKNPDDQRNFHEAMNKTSFVRDFPVDIVRKDGQVRACLITASVSTTENFMGYHGIIRDITDRRRNEELLKEKEITEKTSKLKEKFLANVSHEMRTPLNAVLGMSHLLMKTPINQEQHNYISTIIGSSEHLLGIINDILEISKLQYGELKLQQKCFDVEHLITEVFNLISFQAAEKGIQAELRIDGGVGSPVIGDPLRLREIVLNLCTNAIKFTEKGRIRITVHVADESEDAMTLQFKVSDTGIGIEEDKLDVIFENFTRVSDNKEKIYEGVGLGLAIVKNLVELQGGTVSVESTFGKGSLFIVEIPFPKGEPDEIEDTSKKIKPQITGRDSDVTIMLVEDEKVNQLVASKIIMKEWPKAVLIVADNGKQAIEKLESEPVEIILMDIQMPVMNGIDATKYIRENMGPGKAEIPILAMTAHVNISKEGKYEEYGMNDCILKPFTPDELFKKIGMYLNKNIQAKDQTMKRERIPETFQLINMGYLDLMADGDAEMKAILLEMLLKEPEEEFHKMERFALEKNWEDLKQVSHKMKTTLPYIGYEKLIETNIKLDRLLWEYQQNSHGENEVSDKAPKLIQEVIQLYANAKKELEVAFNNVKLLVEKT